LYLLDTNTLIYFFKNIGNVSEVLLSKPPKKIAIPAITLYELEVGIAKSNNPSKRRKQLNEFVSQISVYQFGAKEAAIAAHIRATLESQGTPIGPYDTLIAGIALSTKSILVTHNTKEFNRIKKLNIEDWF
jgi:tRNA(fMet)-specific endonuclease VapC